MHSGRYVKEADLDIIRFLKKAGRMVQQGQVRSFILFFSASLLSFLNNNNYWFRPYFWCEISVSFVYVAYVWQSICVDQAQLPVLLAQWHTSHLQGITL